MICGFTLAFACIAKFENGCIRNPPSKCMKNVINFMVYEEKIYLNDLPIYSIKFSSISEAKS